MKIQLNSSLGAIKLSIFSKDATAVRNIPDCKSSLLTTTPPAGTPVSIPAELERHINALPAQSWPTSHLDLAPGTRVAADRADDAAAVHLDAVVVDVEDALVPGTHVDVVVTTALHVLQVHDVVPVTGAARHQ